MKWITSPITGWIAAFLFFSLWILSALAHEKKLSNQKDQKIIESNLIVFNAYRTLSIFDRISQANIKAKQLEDSEHVKVKTVIKTVLKDNECANTDFSDDLTNELRKYERDLRARAATTNTTPLNR
ncbi:phosphate/sulfate permease [Providencia alcalifaciens]|nr:phosphate/sulfate permease [Providencia alcalifaciens]